MIKLRRGAKRRPRNGGLPVVDGKKALAKRRGRFSSNIVSLLRRNLWWIGFYTAIGFLASFGLYQPEDQHVVSTVDNSKKDSVVSTVDNSKKDSVVSTVEQDLPKREPGDSVSTKYPDECTPEQLQLAQNQLPTGKFIHRPWRDASFTKATVRSSFSYNPILMREFYSSDDFKPNHSFFAVIVGWGKNDVPIDTLKIGSRDPKFDSNKWNQKLHLNQMKALPPVPINDSAGKRLARVLVVEWYRSDPSLRELANLYDYSDSDLVLETFDMNKIRSGGISILVKNKMPAAINGGNAASKQPIHYLDISNTEGEDADILMKLLPLLNQVRFMHFEYNKAKSWEKKSQLSSVISRLKTKGLVCYFSGNTESDHALWRITDCFLDYYNHRHWAGIACVNVNHDDVKGLAEKMERKFLETLQKDHNFSVD